MAFASTFELQLADNTPADPPVCHHATTVAPSDVSDGPHEFTYVKAALVRRSRQRPVTPGCMQLGAAAHTA
jgi:hypothetical protein